MHRCDWNTATSQDSITVPVSSDSDKVPDELLLKAKQDGFSDRQIGQSLGCSERAARELRLSHGIRPWVKQVSITELFSIQAGSLCSMMFYVCTEEVAITIHLYYILYILI